MELDPNTASVPQPPPLIPYSDVVFARGLTVTRGGEVLRIRVPPKPFLGFISDHAAMSAVVAIALLGVPAGGVRAGNYASAVVVILGECVALAVVAYLYRLRANSPKSGTTFELNATELILSADTPPPGLMKQDGKIRWTSARPRHAITEIRYNPFDRALLVRAAGHNLLLGLLANEDQRLIDYVASTLTAELASATPKLIP